ncbi:hypothetical protein MLD38_029136 [Melastoma candidum]|uniref:Uncharacterized protein n=2 Tax=Melastoma candidum TaxID=119954 RepID=A0ACB9N5A2_9MYRT|nr:hypothetical protein MLD38_029122 [Melastoma candidum]KAI4330894.1 hypothetical protein MLD38_029136 [Melastoma candidum]
METQKLTMKGYRLEEKKVLKAVRRAGKAPELWPFPRHSHFTSFCQYTSYIVSQCYETHKVGGTNGVHTFFHTPAAYSFAVASDEALASIFSDDNPHACTMMRLHHRRRHRSPESVHLMRHNFSPTPVSFIIITHVPLSPNNFIHFQNNRDSHRFTSRAVLVPPSVAHPETGTEQKGYTRSCRKEQ